ncbi:MAG: metallophosphoesterase [Ignavibacteriaceae bacterium]|nr:metallophosphoesterase [Ignavibacteriaceae bacterium]
MWFVFIRVLLGTALLALTEFYFLRKVLRALRRVFPRLSEKKIKIIRDIYLIIINTYPLFLILAWSYSAITGTSTLVPQDTLFDYIILFPFWGVFILSIQCCVLFLLVDFFRILSGLLIPSQKERILLLQSKVVLAIIAFFILYVPVRIIYDYHSVSVRLVEYKKKDLPAELNNFRITFVSDIQADRYTNSSRLDRFINKVNETQPDIVLIAGDVITSTPYYIQTAANYIGKIKSVFGVYSCVGDHDNWAYRNDNQKSLNEITSALEKHKVEMVDNQNRFIKINDASVQITFVTNTYIERTGDWQLDSLSKSGRESDIRIMLSHQPGNYLIKSASENDYDIFLAGHTHGGQLTFLFPFYNISPTLFETVYLRGDFKFGNLLMIVTRGLGMSLSPFRYNSTPEIVKIVFRKE